MMILRMIILVYSIGLIVLLLLKLGNSSKDMKGVFSLLLFPVMLLTKKGRENLVKGIKNGH